ncbi:MAG TPA: hypothetical protein VM598_14705, partial [Bdellovibrionota bacterium]|nr:hypothetical protein [Bdellovibrionota bacterium]
MSFPNPVQLLIAALALVSAQVSFAQAQAPQPASTVPQAPAVAPGAQVAPQAQAPAAAPQAPFINPDPVQAAASAAANAVAAALQPQALRPVLPTQAILLGTGYDGVVRPSGYEEAIRYYASLCSSSIDELSFARRNARIQARVFGRYAEAFNTLTTAIVRAANTMPPGFALQALLDADKLSKLVVSKLEQGPVGQDPAFPRDQIPIAAYHYVDQFLRFAITAHYEFDVPYW